MAATAPTAPVTDKNAKSEADNKLESRVKARAFEQIGGVPKGYSRTTVAKVGPNAFRVNVYTQEDSGESFVKRNVISHSLYLVLAPDDLIVAA